MATDWSLSKSEITGDLSPSTTTMLTDKDISNISPIPLRNSNSPAPAMCVGFVRPPSGTFYADDGDDVSIGRPDSVCNSNMAPSSTSSDHSQLLNAQRELAIRRLEEAEAFVSVVKAKAEVARIAVETAARRDSSRASGRSRSRFETPVRNVSLSGKYDDAMVGHMHASPDGQLSSDLSALMQRCEEEEPMVEPDMRCTFDIVESRTNEGSNQRVEEFEHIAELRFQEVMAHEQQQKRLFEERAMAMHAEQHAQEQQRIYAAEMQAGTREAQIMSQANFRLDALRKEGEEQIQLLINALHGEALQNALRSQELEQAERVRLVELQNAEIRRREAHHETLETNARIEATAERRHTLILNEERERARANEERLLQAARESEEHLRQVQLKADQEYKLQQAFTLRNQEMMFEAMRRQNELLIAELRASKSSPSTPRGTEYFTISGNQLPEPKPKRALGVTQSDPPINSLAFGRRGSSSATETMNATSTAGGNPGRDPTPPRQPSPGRPNGHGGSSSGGGGGNGPGDGEGNDPRRPPKPETPRKSGDAPKLQRKKHRGGGGDDGSSSSSSSSSDPDDGNAGKNEVKKLLKALKSKKTHVKVPESIKLSTIPDLATKFKTWWSETRSIVAAASGVDDEGLQWFMEIEKEGATFESLSKPGKHFRKLDAVINAAIVKSAHGELAREINLKSELAAKEGKLLRGRQSAWLVRLFFKTAEAAGAMYDLCDLLKIKSSGSNGKAIQLSTFMQNWDAVIAGMKKVPDEDILETLFRKELKVYTQLEHDLALYYRSTAPDPNRSYGFLISSARNWLQRQREDRNREVVQSRLSSNERHLPAAPANGKGGGGGGKGGKRGRSSSESHNANRGRNQNSPAPGEGKGKGKGKSRSGSPKGKGKGKQRSKSPGKGKGGKGRICQFHARGSCNMGDKCWYSHGENVTPAAPAETDTQGSETEVAKPKQKGKAKAKVRVSSPAILLTAMAAAAYAAAPATAYSMPMSGYAELMPEVCQIYDNFRNACAATTPTGLKGIYKDIVHDYESSIEKKHELNVSFDDHVEVSTIEVYHDMYETIPDARDHTYEHSEWRRNLDPRRAEAQAVSRAKKWTKYIYKTSSDFLAMAAKSVRVNLSNASSMFYQTPGEWLSDTGTPLDLIGRDAVDPRLKPFISELNNPLSFQTANDVTTANEQVLMQVAPLGEDICPIIMDNCPSALTVGRRCMKEGWTFYWPAYSPPIFVKPDGTVIPHVVRNDCPYVIDPNMQHVSMPASSPVPRMINKSAREGDADIVENLIVPDEPAEAEQPAAEEDEAKLLTREQRLKLEATSLEHLMTHMPKNPYCASCQRAKMQAAATPSRVKRPNGSEPPEAKFGNITCDHFIASDEIDSSINGDKAGIVCYCKGSKWIDLYATGGKSSKEAEDAFIDFEGPWKSITSFYSDDAPELVSAAQSRGWVVNTATPGRPETNGSAERSVRTVLEGARTALEHSGVPLKFWPYAGRHYCIAHNISHEVAGQTPWDIRHPDMPFKGQIIPFGSLVDFKPSPVKGKIISKFEARSVPGIFLGWFLVPGGRFKGDYLVISLSDLTSHLQKPSSRVFVQRVKEIYRDASEPYIFPLKPLHDKVRRTIDEPLVRRKSVANATAEAEAEADKWLSEKDSTDDKPDEEAPPIDRNPNYQEGGSSSSSKQIIELDDTAITTGPQTPAEVIRPDPLADGRNPRKYRGSTRPPDIWPESWQALSKKRKDEEIAKYKKKIEAENDPVPAVANLTCSLEDEGMQIILDELLRNISTDSPSFPRIKGESSSSHRVKIPFHTFPFSALVARPVGKKEIALEPKAQLALDAEWLKLVKAKVWDEERPREWSEVSALAKKNESTVHLGRVFEICVEKGSELPIGNPGRKFKGRAVFQGNNVRDQNFDWAVFQELGSSPASLTASKIADGYGLASGNTIQQADAEQAYINATLNTTETWVRLPRNRIPAKWQHLKDPVFRLVLALYGHPESGGHWEIFAHKMLLSEGWTPVSPDAMRSVYWHPKFKSVLILYVDDFRISGPKSSMQAAWASIRKHIRTGEPEPSGKFLGCDHKLSQKVIPAGGDPWRDYTAEECRNHRKVGTLVTLNVIEYDMEEFLRSCVTKYCELANIEPGKLGKAETPFIDEVKADKEWQAYQYLRDDKQQNKTSKHEELEEGQLKSISARILMKTFYAARLARWDLLRAIGLLATRITRWSLWDDKRLHKLMQYVNSTYSMRMRSWRSEGDKPDQLMPRLYVDADFAGDAKDSKSCNGIYYHLHGPNTSIQVSATSKKQSCVSHSTPEAEIVAADCGIRNDALPSLDLIELLLARESATVELYEDNETAAHVIRTGKSPAMRYLHRTHRVSVSWLHDLETKGIIKTHNVDTELQKADIFTKPFNDPVKWKTRIVEIGIWYPNSSSVEHKASPKPKPNKTGTSKINTSNDNKPSIPVAAASTHAEDKLPYRTIIEFCCGKDSKLGQKGKYAQSRGCRVVRVTEQHDVTQQHGVDFVNKLVDECEGTTTLLFAAIPCTGGSPWMNINIHKPGGAARLRRHLKTFRMIWSTFASCARKLAAKGGKIAMEWPRGCRYWKYDFVIEFLAELNMACVSFDGCMLNLRSKSSQELIKKPWQIATNCEELVKSFHGFLCDKSHSHVPCAGQNTRETESYSYEMVQTIHKAFAKHVANISKSVTLPAMTCRLLNCSVTSVNNAVDNHAIALLKDKLPSLLKDKLSPLLKDKLQSPLKDDELIQLSFPVSHIGTLDFSLEAMSAGSSSGTADPVPIVVDGPTVIADDSRLGKLRAGVRAVEVLPKFFMTLSLLMLSISDNAMLQVLKQVDFDPANGPAVLERVLSQKSFYRSTRLLQGAAQKISDNDKTFPGIDLKNWNVEIAGDSTTCMKSKSGKTFTSCVKETSSALNLTITDHVVGGATLTGILELLRKDAPAGDELKPRCSVVFWQGNDFFNQNGQPKKMSQAELDSIVLQAEQLIDILNSREASAVLFPQAMDKIYGYHDKHIVETCNRIEQLFNEKSSSVLIDVEELYLRNAKSKSDAWHIAYSDEAVANMASYLSDVIRVSCNLAVFQLCNPPEETLCVGNNRRNLVYSTKTKVARAATFLSGGKAHSLPVPDSVSTTAPAPIPELVAGTFLISEPTTSVTALQSEPAVVTALISESAAASASIPEPAVAMDVIAEPAAAAASISEPAVAMDLTSEPAISSTIAKAKQVVTPPWANKTTERGGDPSGSSTAAAAKPAVIPPWRREPVDIPGNVAPTTDPITEYYDIADNPSREAEETEIVAADPQRVRGIKVRGTYGDFVERGANSGPAAARALAEKLNKSATDKRFRDYKDRFQSDPAFREDQIRHGRPAHFADQILAEIPANLDGKARREKQYSPLVAEVIARQDELAQEKARRNSRRQPTAGASSSSSSWDRSGPYSQSQWTGAASSAAWGTAWGSGSSWGANAASLSDIPYAGESRADFLKGMLIILAFIVIAFILKEVRLRLRRNRCQVHQLHRTRIAQELQHIRTNIADALQARGPDGRPGRYVMPGNAPGNKGKGKGKGKVNRPAFDHEAFNRNFAATLAAGGFIPGAVATSLVVTSTPNPGSSVVFYAGEGRANDDAFIWTAAVIGISLLLFGGNWVIHWFSRRRNLSDAAVQTSLTGVQPTDMHDLYVTRFGECYHLAGCETLFGPGRTHVQPLHKRPCYYCAPFTPTPEHAV